MNLSNVDLLQLQPNFMKRDIPTQGICAALNPKMRYIAPLARMVAIWKNIDNLPEKIIDELAWSLYIKWYDYNADIDKKRAFVKNAIKVHRSMGTIYAVEQVVSDYLGDTAIVQEWFEYGREPGYFRVLINKEFESQEQADRLIAAIYMVKNVRSWLDGIILLRSETEDLVLYDRAYISDLDFMRLTHNWNLGETPFIKYMNRREV